MAALMQTPGFRGPSNNIFGAYGGQPNALPAPQAITDQYKLYNTGVQQNAEDYGRIMKGYQDLTAKAPSSDYTAAVGNLKDLATTGGYSPEAIADIRARGISPIRSIYSSANRDVDRQRALQGGYSPNYGAVKAKMARELSDTISNATTNINADLAQRVAGNRVATAGTYANAADRQDNTALESLRGQASLYGTTPAMASLFGQQALQGAQLQNQINQAPAVPQGGYQPNTGGFGANSSMMTRPLSIRTSGANYA